MATRPPLVPLVPGAVSAPAPAAPVAEVVNEPAVEPAPVAEPVAPVAGARKQAVLTADGWLCPEA